MNNDENGACDNNITPDKLLKTLIMKDIDKSLFPIFEGHNAKSIDELCKESNQMATYVDKIKNSEPITVPSLFNGLM